MLLIDVRFFFFFFIGKLKAPEKHHLHFFFFDKKHEIFIQLEKSYSRESKQTLRENYKQLHTTPLNEPDSPTIFLSLYVNIFGVSVLGLQ